MKFLDQKEQVIDLQLTQHGKRLLSQGIFKPVYYAFGDDDVLYDSDYASASYNERQSDIEPRIQEKTPRLSVQANYASAESLVPNDASLLSQRLPRYNYALKEDPDKHTPIKFKLGTSSPQSDKLPAWSVAFLNGELSGSSYTYTDVEGEIHYIPQLNAKINYNIKIKTKPPATLAAEVLGILNPDEDVLGELSPVHADGSFVEVKDDYILLRILENNVPFSKENYDLEVYDVLRDGAELRPLSLSSDREENQFLVEDVDGSDAGDLNDRVSEADYYVEALVDDEVDPRLLTSLIMEKVGSIYLDKDLKRFTQRVQENVARRDIYRSTVDSTERCEE